MSWRFPRYEIRDQDVIDYHAWNENAIPFVEEATGMLNEHNFKYGGLNDLSKWADDVGYRLHHVKQEADPNSYNTNNPSAGVSDGVRDDDGRSKREAGAGPRLVRKGKVLSPRVFREAGYATRNPRYEVLGGRAVPDLEFVSDFYVRIDYI